MAKFFGVGVEEFGFGYPPRVLGKKIGGTIYSINLIPFGGFAQIKGMMAEDTGGKDHDSFASQPKLKRVLILCGGIFGNFVLAWILFVFLFIFGNPILAEKVLVEEVAEGSPAAEVGIAAGDYILSFEGEPVATADELVGLIADNVGRLSVMEIERGGETRLAAAIPRTDYPEDEGSLGLALSTGVAYEKAAVWRAPVAAAAEAIETVGQMARLVARLIRDLIRGETVEVGGPVAILALTETYASYGVRIFLQFVALLSINLVVVNLLPFPALDGGRLLFVVYEAVRGRRSPFRVEQFINNIGFIMIIILSFLIAVKDIRTFF